MTNIMQQYYDDILENGEKHLPRGLETVGLTNQVFTFVPGQVFTRLGGNISIGFVELLQFISGTFDIEPFRVVAPNARLELFTRQSAYGPRTVEQLPRIIEELINDIDSRRAVMTIMYTIDTPETMPCTLNAQFQVEDVDGIKSLVTTWNMRSSDLIWGLPTDIIQFGGISLMVANCIGVRAVECIVNAGNAHIYTATRLKPGEQFDFAGTFELPNLYTLDAYKAWANAALKFISEEKIMVKSIFPIHKEVEHDSIL